MLLWGDLRWDHLAGSPGRWLCSHRTICLTAGLRKAAHEAVNYDNSEITQGPDKTQLFSASLKLSTLDPTPSQRELLKK